MSGLMEGARLMVLALLVGLVVTTMLLVGSVPAVLVVGGLGIALTAAGAWALWDGREMEFSLSAGASLVLNITAMVLYADQGYAVTWAAFGIGLATLMAGNHTCRSAEVLLVRRKVGEGGERSFHRAALRGYLRVVLFVGLVMIISLLLLLLSLNAAVGTMPSWAMAGLALMAMISLALLALVRHSNA